MPRSFVVSAVALALLPALSATDALAQGSERFVMERSGSGYVRLDTQTGTMSLCNVRDDALVCRRAVDGEAMATDEIDSLHDRLEALETRIAALEAANGGASNMPSEQEFEQTLGMMERFFRRFMDIVRSFENEPETGGGEQEAPAGRT